MDKQPASMRALMVEQAGAPFAEVRLPRPVAGPGEVLVRIVASGVNPLDTKIRAGQAAHVRQPLPAILGMDLAGVVAATGAGVTRFRAGDEVYGMAGGVGGLQGTLAEHAAVDAHLLALKPRKLTMREAAALPLAVITAWEGLVDRAQVHAGQKVLVLGPLSFRAATYSGVFTLRPMLTGAHRPHHGEILREAAQLADAGLLLPRLDERRFDFSNALLAHELVAQGHAKGKVVVEVEGGQ